MIPDGQKLVSDVISPIKIYYWYLMWLTSTRWSLLLMCIDAHNLTRIKKISLREFTYFLIFTVICFNNTFAQIEQGNTPNTTSGTASLVKFLRVSKPHQYT